MIILFTLFFMTVHAMESKGEKALSHVQKMQATWNNEKQKYQEAINKLCAENKDLKERLALREQSYVESIKTLRSENDTLKTQIEYWFAGEKSNKQSSIKSIYHTPVRQVSQYFSGTENITFTYQTPVKKEETVVGKGGGKGIFVTLTGYSPKKKTVQKEHEDADMIYGVWTPGAPKVEEEAPLFEKERKSLPVSRGLKRKLFQ